MTLDELAALEKAATPGPWHYLGKTSGKPDGEGVLWPFVLGPGQENAICYTEGDYWTEHENCGLIAASRNMLPKLIAVARAAKTCLLYNSIDYDGGLEDALRSLEGEA